MTAIQPITCANHQPICPNCGQGYNHPQQSSSNNYNGVAIDIHNPTVNIPPYNPIYEVPKTNIYPQQTNVEDVK